MNRQYIDFVPISRVKKAPKTTVVSVKTTTFVEPDENVFLDDDINDDLLTEDDLETAKSEKVGGVKVVQKTITERTTEVVAEVDKNVAPVEKKVEMKIPQVNFINQEKVVKRPLSKNVYVKKEEVKEEPEEEKEPVVIVENEKKSKAGTVIAIIVAIILGAAAGTAVFFLLPK